MLTLNLQPIFKARAIDKPFSYLVKAGLTHNTAHQLINNKLTSIRYSHIELLCRLLTCEPSDLFRYTPDTTNPLSPNHPLLNLKQEDESTTLQETFATMPFRQLKEVTKAIQQTKP